MRMIDVISLVRKSRYLAKYRCFLDGSDHMCVTLRLPFLIRHLLSSFLSALQASLQKYRVLCSFSNLPPQLISRGGTRSVPIEAWRVQLLTLNLEASSLIRIVASLTL